jgi:N6-adenosine-specific RNA methylase IME4
MDTGPGFASNDSDHEPLAYPTMSLEEIAALDVASLAADDAHLYLWTTNCYLHDLEGRVRAWGFRYSTTLVWAKKPQGVGLGDTFRLTTEFVLSCRRGSLQSRCIVPQTCFHWPRGRHSAKPQEFYGLAESVTPGPYLDLFARAPREGWTVWGDEGVAA